MSHKPTALLLSLGLATLLGCHITANDHCANNGGDIACADNPAGSFCNACDDENDGCAASIAEIEKWGDDCYSPGTDTGDDGSGDDGTTPDDGSSGDDGTSPDDGGTGTTDTTDDGTTGTGSGGTTLECNAANGEPDTDDCTDAAAPFCVGNQCKDCSETSNPDTSCAALGADTDYCDTTAKECVACLAHAHCTDPQNARCNDSSHTCVPCQANPECANITNHEVCNAGSCVECTTTDDDACNGDVCHALDHECTNNAPGSAGLCEECVANAHCSANKLCIAMTFKTPDVVGYYCLFERDAPAPPNGDCDNVPPYADGISATSIEGGEPADVCGLRETTCVGRHDYGNACNPGGGGDDECGMAGLDDGLCRQENGGDYSCTYECVFEEDCPGSQLCTTGEWPEYCEL